MSATSNHFSPGETAFRSIAVALRCIANTLAFLVLLVALSGAIRAATGLPLTYALTASGCLVFAVYKLTTKRTSSSAISVYLLFATFAYAAFRFYHPLYRGLVSVGGGDAGLHAFFQHQFGADPNVYHSFVTFFAGVRWLQTLSTLDTFEAFRVLFYLIVFLVLYFIFLLASLHEHPESAAQRPKYYYPIFLFLGFYPAERILFPILHYLQGEGFFPQLCGILPVLLCWYVAESVEARSNKVLFMLGSLGLLRFTYGLNFPELVFAVASIVVLEAQIEADRRRKLAYIFLALTLAALGLAAYIQLSFVFTMDGGTVKTNLPQILFAQILITLALVLFRMGPAKTRTPLMSGRGLFVFPIVFVLFSSLAWALYPGSEGTPTYYAYKQTLLASLVASIAACLLCTGLLTHLTVAWTRLTPGEWLKYVVMLSLSFVGLWELKQGYFPYQPSYRERVHHESPQAILLPLVDAKAWELIDESLKQSGETFAGYITPLWPVSSFMNSAFGFFGELPFYRSGRIPHNRSGCVFWNSEPAALEAYGKIGVVAKSVAELSQRPEIKKVSYVDDSTRPPSARELSISCPSTVR